MQPPSPKSRPYDRLREQLVKHTGTSPQRRLQQLLAYEKLGDRKPSQLLRRMKQLLGDRSMDSDDALVPEPSRHVVFNKLHSLSHPDVRATERLVTSQYVWPNIKTDVRRWAQSCLQCQRSKIERHTITPLAMFSTPDARFDMVHVHLVGPLPPSRGFTYLASIVLHVGQKPYPSLTAQQRVLQTHLWADGLLGLAPHRPSRPTGAASLSPRSGLSLLHCSVLNVLEQPPTTP